MDLKEVIADVHNKAYEADKAFKAGNEEEAKTYLADVRAILEAYTEVPATPAGDVTESVTSEKAKQASQETPAQVTGAQAQPAGVVPFADPSKPLPASQFVQPNQ